MTATSTASVTVNQTPTSIAVSPSSASLNASSTQQFAATALDQFNAALATQPTFIWSTASGSSSVGSINASGLLTASNTSATGLVTVGYPLAGGGTLSGSSTVTVTEHAPTVATTAAASPGTVAGTTTVLSVLGTDVRHGASLTYSWAATTLPSGAASPIFSVNGTTAADNTTATFGEAGSYTFTVTITDPGGMTAASTVTVTVNQTLTSIAVAGQPPVATAYDQFANPLVNQPAFDAGSDTITGPLTLSSKVTVVPAVGSPLTIAGQIDGSGSLAMTGGGHLVLNVANAFSGGLIVQSGTVVVGAANGLLAGSSLTVGSASALNSPSIDWAAASLVAGSAANSAPALSTPTSSKGRSLSPLTRWRPSWPPNRRFPRGFAQPPLQIAPAVWARSPYHVPFSCRIYSSEENEEEVSIAGPSAVGG